MLRGEEKTADSGPGLWNLEPVVGSSPDSSLTLYGTQFQFPAIFISLFVMLIFVLLGEFFYFHLLREIFIFFYCDNYWVQLLHEVETMMDSCY